MIFQISYKDGAENDVITVKADEFKDFLNLPTVCGICLGDVISIDSLHIDIDLTDKEFLL